jgi:hypothetical protein
LLDEVMLATGAVVDVVLRLVEGAWSRFEQGDHEGYLDAVAAALCELGEGADAVVLAQASMAPAVGRVEMSVPVLSSPRLAIESLRAFAS